MPDAMLHFREVFTAARLLRHTGLQPTDASPSAAAAATAAAFGEPAAAAVAAAAAEAEGSRTGTVTPDHIAAAATAAAASGESAGVSAHDPEATTANRRLLDGELFQDAASAEARLRVVGQEPRHTLLFTWDGPPGEGAGPGGVTGAGGWMPPRPATGRPAAAGDGGGGGGGNGVPPGNDAVPQRGLRTFVAMFDTETRECRCLYDSNLPPPLPPLPVSKGLCIVLTN